MQFAASADKKFCAIHLHITNAQLGGDPCPGTVKVLTLVYSDKNGPHMSQTWENKDLSLTGWVSPAELSLELGSGVIVCDKHACRAGSVMAEGRGIIANTPCSSDTTVARADLWEAAERAERAERCEPTDPVSHAHSGSSPSCHGTTF